jgi:hypothetical protein
MCMNCGCGEPSERHGRTENITIDDVRKAGEANGQSVQESLHHMSQAAREYLSAEGQGAPGAGQAGPGGRS